MCGIAGIISIAGKADLSYGVMKRMLSSIRHRGPDESGFYTDGRASVGNVRLSIIDISTGQQPMSNQRGNLWIVFNGEIFNYIELREELKSLGRNFRTGSDTEVLLQLYEQYGSQCVSKLNGQFAFAIWDTESGTLFMARDRVGIRPLYYTMQNGVFVFASEIKAILEYPGINAQPDPKAMAQFFTFWTPLPGYSLFQNIRELEPGHTLLLKDGKTDIGAYWELSFAPKGNYITQSFKEAKEEFNALLLDAVKLRLRSDVPVAAYLSGGIDSSVTTAFIKQISPQHLQTFSIGFADAGYDETLFQREVSDYLHTQHVSFTCTAEDVAKVFPEVIWYSESPVFRTAPAPMFLLSRKVRENNIKVVMTGEGADEILAGYDIFKEAQIRYFWAKYPDSKYRPLLLKKLYPYVSQISSMNASMLKFVFGLRLSEINHPFYAFLLRWNNGSFLRKYFSEQVQSRLNGYLPEKEAESILPRSFYSWDELSRAQWVESKLLMSNYLLSSQGDRMGMANSIEGRYPYLDYRVIEYAAKLPPTFKMKGLNEKFLLKKMMDNRLPDSVLKRSKQAYRAPIIPAFLTGKSPDFVNYYLSGQKIKDYGLFDAELVDKLLVKLRGGKNVSENDAMALTAILSAQLFYAMYVDRSFRPVPLQMLKNTRVIDAGRRVAKTLY